LRKMSDSLYKRQSAPNGADEKWTILEDLREAGVLNVTEPTATLYSSVSSQHELVVSGVFIRLFITNPGWVLRKPKEFLVDLFELWLDLTNRKMQDGEHLELSTQALVQLFIAQPVLLDNLTSMGVLPQVIQVVESKKDSIVGAGLNVFHQVANSENCLKSMSTYEVMGPIKQAMLTRRDLVHLSAEALAKLFSTQSVVDEFVGQVYTYTYLSLFSARSSFISNLSEFQGVEMQFDRRDAQVARDQLGPRGETGLGESTARKCHQSHAQLCTTFESSESIVILFEFICIVDHVSI